MGNSSSDVTDPTRKDVRKFVKKNTQLSGLGYVSFYMILNIIVVFTSQSWR